jgi:predicted MFS family arabinose efflux permease
VLGPVLGAMLYARTGALTGVVIIEAATYACSALMLINLPRFVHAAKSGRGRGFRREIMDGLRYVKSEPDLRQIFTMLSAAGMTVGLFLTLLRPFISEVLHGDDRTYATLVSAFGLGGMLGPLFGFWAGRRLGLGRMLTLCFCLEPILLVLWSRTESVGPSAALLFLWGVDVFALIPCYTSYLHIYSRKDHMGRTFALFDQSAYVPQIIAAAVVTFLGNRLPTQNILTTVGLGYLLIMLGTLGTHGSRLLRVRNGRPRPEPEKTPQKTPELPPDSPLHIP